MTRGFLCVGEREILRWGGPPMTSTPGPRERHALVTPPTVHRRARPATTSSQRPVRGRTRCEHEDSTVEIRYQGGARYLGLRRKPAPSLLVGRTRRRRVGRLESLFPVDDQHACPALGRAAVVLVIRYGFDAVGDSL